MQLTIRYSNGSKFAVQLQHDNNDGIDNDNNNNNTAWTVLDVKKAIEKASPDQTPIALQRLIYKGRILDNDQSPLDGFGIVDKATVFLVKKSNASSISATTTQPSTQPAVSTTTSATSSAMSSAGLATAGVPSTTTTTNNNNADWISRMLQQQQQQQQQIFPSSSSSPPIFPGFAAAAQQQQQGGVPPLPDPQSMQEMMSSPFVQGLLDNPNLLQSLLQAQMRDNPALQQMMQQNPQIREVLQDPASLRQMAQFMRNPQALQMAQRQQDLALSQLENVPGGFAALSSLYRNVQAPLEESLMESSSSNHSQNGGNAQSSSAQARQLHRSSSNGVDEGASGAAMPNPWAPVSSRPAVNNNNNNSTAAPSSIPSFPNPFLSSMLGGGAAGFPMQQQQQQNHIVNMSNNPWATGPQGQGAQLPPEVTAAAAGMSSAASSSPQQREMAMQLLDNPAIQQWMQSTLESNPDFVRGMLEAQDPNFARLFRDPVTGATNTAAANRFVQSMMQPQTMRSLLQLQEQMYGGGGAGGNAGTTGGSGMAVPPMMDFANMFAANPQFQQLQQQQQQQQPFASSPFAAAAAAAGAGFGGAGTGGTLDFSSLLQSLQASGAAGSSNNSIMSQSSQSSPPSLYAPATASSSSADLYQRQLRSLYDMGFDDEQRSLQALTLFHGNLNRAVDHLLSTPPPAATAVVPAAATAPTTNGEGSATTTTMTTTADGEQHDSTSATMRDGADEAFPSLDDATPKDATEKKND